MIPYVSYSAIDDAEAAPYRASWKSRRDGTD